MRRRKRRKRISVIWFLLVDIITNLSNMLTRVSVSVCATPFLTTRRYSSRFKHTRLTCRYIAVSWHRYTCLNNHKLFVQTCPWNNRTTPLSPPSPPPRPAPPSPPPHTHRLYHFHQSQQDQLERGIATGHCDIFCVRSKTLNIKMSQLEIFREDERRVMSLTPSSRFAGKMMTRRRQGSYACSVIGYRLSKRA